MRKSWRTLKILQGGNRLIKLLNHKHILLCLKRNNSNEWVMGPEGRAKDHTGLFPSPETQWSLPCWISKFLGIGGPFLNSISFLLTGLCIPGILLLSHLYLGSRLPISYFSQIHRDEFCPQIYYILSHSHTWFRLFRYRFGIFQLMRLNKILDFQLIPQWVETFGEYWDEVNVSGVWDRHESLGARG